MVDKQLDRRTFMKFGLAGLATAAVGAAFTSRKAEVALNEPEEQSPHSWAMVIDQSKCVGCEQCVLACQANNDVSPEITWNRVRQVESIGDEEVFLPVQCMHCEDAPCVHVCPVSASYYRPDGIVMMDYDRCIGCRYCEIACPYGARSFNWETFDGENPAVPKWGQPEIPRRPRGVVEKCSFCYQKIDRGLSFGLVPGVDQAATPACVVACPRGARLFGDLNDPDSSVSQALAKHSSFRLREDLGTGPRVYYLPAQPNDEEENI